MAHLGFVFSFLEGLALILSPCILPVLPLVLSTSVTGGYKRPLGVISGFVFSFTCFALASRFIVAVLHINLDYIKYGSLLLLGLFGLIMFSEKLLDKFANTTQSLATLGTQLSINAKDGYLGGIFIGFLIGLVWTPCAGPILAAALVQVIREQNTGIALLLILSFAIGASIPMLLISLLGRTIMSKLRVFGKYASITHKVIGTLILLSVCFIASGATLPSLSSGNGSVIATNNLQLENGLTNPYKAPDFAAADIWLNNSKPLTIASLKGHVVLVDFWTYSCINCLRTLPYLNSWYSKYHDKGLVIVGVHAPEFEFEKNKSNVLDAITRYKILYPVALDNNLDTWTNYNNQYWPAHYLIDKNGNVVYTSFGEGDYAATEKNIQKLLDIKAIPVANDTLSFNRGQTPETYLGYKRADSFVDGDSLAKDVVGNYTIPTFVPANEWAMSGKWLVNPQKIVTVSTNNKLVLNFTARHVYLVLGSTDNKAITLKIKLNGKNVGSNGGIDVKNNTVKVINHRLYDLIDQGSVKNSLLEIEVSNPNLEAYAFTFGS